MDIEVRHLKLIATVAQEGSLSKAGQALHLTQSALSHQLRDIEDRLDVALFLRSNKKMILTPAGEKLLQSATTVMRELESVNRQINQIARGESGTIRLSTQCYTCYHWLPEILRKYQKEFPHVDVKIIVEATHHPIKALQEGKLDIAIVHSQKNDGLIRKPLFKDELKVIVSPKHRWAKRKYIELKELEDEPLYLYNVPEKDSHLFQEVLIPAGVYPKNISHIQLTEAIVEFVKAGLGVGVMATWAAKPHVDNASLVAVRLGKSGVVRQWSAAVLPNGTMPRYIESFINEIVSFSKPAKQQKKQIKDGNKIF